MLLEYRKEIGKRKTFAFSIFIKRVAWIIANFKKSIWNREDDISKIPEAFDIESTSYQAKEGIVRVKMRFNGGDYWEIKEYTYALKKSQGYWEIYDYQVRNMGTEPKTSTPTASHSTSSTNSHAPKTQPSAHH